MGNSSKGLLAYGINLGFREERARKVPWGTRSSDSFETVYGELLGVRRPDEEKSDQSVWVEYFHLRSETIKASGVNLFTYGHVEFAGEILAASQSVIVTSDWGALVLSNNALNMDPVWGDQLREACRLLDIPFTPPSWILTSRYS